MQKREKRYYIIRTIVKIMGLLFIIKDYPKDNLRSYGLWYDLVIGRFYPYNIDDVTDIDNGKTLCYQYLISLNKSNENLSDDTIDSLIKTDNAYF